MSTASGRLNRLFCRQEAEGKLLRTRWLFSFFFCFDICKAQIVALRFVLSTPGRCAPPPPAGDIWSVERNGPAGEAISYPPPEGVVPTKEGPGEDLKLRVTQRIMHFV